MASAIVRLTIFILLNQGNSGRSLLQSHCRYSLPCIAFSLHTLVSPRTLSFRRVLWSAPFHAHVVLILGSAGACGLSFLQFCNLNSFRTKFIMGFSLFMGLSVPQYFNEYTSVAGYGPVHTGARWVRELELALHVIVLHCK